MEGHQETKMNTLLEEPGINAERRPRILIAGMGNILLKDDGVGVHAVKRFPPAESGEYRAVEVGCAVFDALHLFDWAERILLIDAMQAGRAARDRVPGRQPEGHGYGNRAGLAP